MVDAIDTSAPQPARMRDHWWWRPGQRVGRRFYTFHGTFNNDTIIHGLDAVQQMVRAYQSHLVMPGLDLVPLAWLHLTMQGVGFVDEVSDHDIARIIQATRTRCAGLAPFTVTLGPARLRAEAVGLYVTPAEPVQQVRAAVRAAIADVWGADQVPEPDDGFTPHVTLAYSNTDGPTGPPLEVLAKLPPMSAAVTLQAVSLIVLGRDEHLYCWTTRATVHLGQEGAPPSGARPAQG